MAQGGGQPGDDGAARGRGRRRSLRDGGYTLIELAAVMGIVLILSVAAVSVLQSVRKADISTSSQRLAAAVRYLYDLSVLNNRPYRLVIDFTENAYWGETMERLGTCGKGLLPSDEERKTDAREAAKKKAAAKLKTSGSAAGAAEDADAEVPTGRQVKDNLLTRKELPKGLVFGGLMTAHQEERTEEGRGEIYFFPSGYVERAYIFLKRDEEVYTIETLPMKGVGIVHPEELDSRDLLDRG